MGVDILVIVDPEILIRRGNAVDHGMLVGRTMVGDRVGEYLAVIQVGLLARQVGILNSLLCIISRHRAADVQSVIIVQSDVGIGP